MLDASTRAKLFWSAISGDEQRFTFSSIPEQKALTALKSTVVGDVGGIAARACHAAVALGDQWNARLWACIAAGLNGTMLLPPSFELFWPSAIYKVDCNGDLFYLPF